MSEGTFLFLNLMLVCAIIFVGRIAFGKRREVKKAKQELELKRANEPEIPVDIDPVDRAKMEEQQQLERIKRQLALEQKYLGDDEDEPATDENEATADSEKESVESD